MPNTLADMFQARGLADNEPIGFGDALQQRSNSLVGLGLGLLQPYRPWAAESPYSNALQGYMGGAQVDARTAHAQAQVAHQKRQEGRQAAQDRFQRDQAKQAQINWEKQFARSDPEAGPPPTVESYDPVSKQNVLFQWDRQSRGYKRATQGGTGTVTTAGGDGAAPEAQPMLPPRKPLTAAEETAVTKADEAVQASQGIKQSLSLAKELSKKAASGPGAYTRGYAGQFLPGPFGAGGKETMELHNVVTTTALEQLKTIFGSNPTEGERKILLDIQGSVDQSDDVRQGIFDRAMEAADKRIETNRLRAQQLREGTYYRPGGGPAATPASPGGAVRKYNPATGKIE